MRVFSQSLSVLLRLLFTRGEIKWKLFFCFIFLIGCGKKNSAVYRSLIENFEAKSEIKIAYEKPKSAVQKVEIRKIKPILEKIEPTQRPEIKPEISGTFDFKQLMVIADQRSPKLNAIRQEFNSIKQRYSQIDELNNLLVQYRFFTKQLQIPVGKSHHKSMINLRFPLPNTLTLKRKIIDIDLMIAEKKSILLGEICKQRSSLLTLIYCSSRQRLRCIRRIWHYWISESRLHRRNTVQGLRRFKQ